MGLRMYLRKAAKRASPGGAGVIPCSGFEATTRPVGTDGRRAYAMPPFLGAPAVGRVGGTPLSGQGRDGCGHGDG